MKVVLSSEQMAYAEKVGRMRFETVMQRGVADYHRAVGETQEARLKAHIDGAIGEAVIVAVLGGKNVTWHRNGWAVSPRVQTVCEIEYRGAKIDAKSISKNHLSLLVPKGTVKQDWVYILVGIGNAPVCYILGWTFGHEVLQVPLIELQPGRPAHVVKQGLLREFEQFLQDYR